MPEKLPPVVSPQKLAEHLADDNLLIVDVCAPAEFEAAHIPGAVQVEYSDIVTGSPPVMGLISDNNQLSIVFSAIGLTSSHHVVAYDRAGGGQAGRLLYTLEALGHANVSLLDGGMQAWVSHSQPLEQGPAQPVASHYEARLTGDNIATKEYILSRLGAPDLALLDCRTPAEFQGTDLRASRGGHIPGAINFDWTEAFDPANPPSLADLDTLQENFNAMGVTADKEVILYCQTHTRSSHTYMLLRQLGYENLKGYPGAWSDWGNDPSTPIDQ